MLLSLCIANEIPSYWTIGEQYTGYYINKFLSVQAKHKSHLLIINRISKDIDELNVI